MTVAKCYGGPLDGKVVQADARRICVPVFDGHGRSHREYIVNEIAAETEFHRKVDTVATEDDAGKALAMFAFARSTWELKPQPSILTQFDDWWRWANVKHNGMPYIVNDAKMQAAYVDDDAKNQSYDMAISSCPCDVVCATNNEEDQLLRSVSVAIRHARMEGRSYSHIIVPLWMRSVVMCQYGTEIERIYGIPVEWYHSLEQATIVAVELMSIGNTCLLVKE